VEDLPRLEHVRVNVSDLRRDRAGVEVVESLFDTPYGSRKFTVRDPDGNEIGFVRED
jgi:uncharacterized glyoxalase superfamily protein PhnB